MFEFDLNLFIHILLAVLVVSFIPAIFGLALTVFFGIISIAKAVISAVRNFSWKTAIPPAMPDFTTCPDCGLHIEVCNCVDDTFDEDKTP